MAEWHHWLDGRESEWTLGDGDGQGGLECCSSWVCKELDITERLNWTEQLTFFQVNDMVWHSFLHMDLLFLIHLNFRKLEILEDQETYLWEENSHFPFFRIKTCWKTAKTKQNKTKQKKKTNKKQHYHKKVEKNCVFSFLTLSGSWP